MPFGLLLRGRYPRLLILLVDLSDLNFSSIDRKIGPKVGIQATIMETFSSTLKISHSLVFLFIRDCVAYAAKLLPMTLSSSKSSQFNGPEGIFALPDYLQVRSLLTVNFPTRTVLATAMVPHLWSCQRDIFDDDRSVWCLHNTATH